MKFIGSANTVFTRVPSDRVTTTQKFLAVKIVRKKKEQASKNRIERVVVDKDSDRGLPSNLQLSPDGRLGPR